MYFFQYLLIPQKYEKKHCKKDTKYKYYIYIK